MNAPIVAMKALHLREVRWTNRTGQSHIGRAFRRIHPIGACLTRVRLDCTKHRLSRDSTAMISDDYSDASPPSRRERKRWLDGVDWRLVGATALAAGVSRFGWLVDAVEEGGWVGVLVAFGRIELFGLLVLVFAAALVRLHSRALPRPLALALGVIAGSVVAWMINAPASGTLGAGFPGGEPSYWTRVWFFTRTTALFWGILAAGWYFMQRANEREAALRESELARHRLETQLAEARLRVLQAQVEPHFLFNTLAHVKRLYKTNPVVARQMLDSFCEYLRAALPQMRSERGTLGTELSLACAYLDVQKIRMGERLEVEIAVPEPERQRPFPTMMLASLVENAIKHGLNPLPEGGMVRLSAESSPASLRVVVADSGRGFSTSRGTGVGLANIRGRLAAIYGAAARITLAPNAPRGIRATIEIPTATVAGSHATAD
jgi:Histidine kinase